MKRACNKWFAKDDYKTYCEFHTYLLKYFIV